MAARPGALRARTKRKAKPTSPARRLLNAAKYLGRVEKHLYQGCSAYLPTPMMIGNYNARKIVARVRHEILMEVSEMLIPRLKEVAHEQA